MAKNEKKAGEITPDDTTGKNETVTVKAEPKKTDLVKMKRDGESLHVHPTTVTAHKAAGWKVA